MVDGQAGKGPLYRKVDREKYERNYMRIYAFCNQNLCPKRSSCDRYQNKVGKNNVTWVLQDDYSACEYFVPVTCQMCMGRGWFKDWSDLQKKYLKTKCIICQGTGKLGD